MKSFQAHGKAGHVTRDTARAAAVAYFEVFPTSRKCDVTEGKVEGSFFVVTYGRTSEGEWPQRYKDVTKKTAGGLPA